MSSKSRNENFPDVEEGLAGPHSPSPSIVDADRFGDVSLFETCAPLTLAEEAEQHFGPVTLENNAGNEGEMAADGDDGQTQPSWRAAMDRFFAAQLAGNAIEREEAWNQLVRSMKPPKTNNGALGERHHARSSPRGASAGSNGNGVGGERRGGAAAVGAVVETISDDTPFSHCSNFMESNADNEGKWAASAAPRAMIETTDDDAPPAPFNSMEFDADNEGKWAVAETARAVVETTDDDAPPAPFNSIEFDADNEGKWAAAAASRAMIETTDDEAAPAPFNSMEFDADNEGKWVAAAASRAMIETTDDEAAPAPFNSMVFDADNERQWAGAVACDELRDRSAQFQTGLASNRVPLFLSDRESRIHDIDIYSRPGHASESRTYPAEEDGHVAVDEREDLLEADVERDSAILVPEATLVNEEEVIIATTLEPTIPWWKQRRTIMLLSMLLLLVVVSAALGATRSLNNNEGEPELTVSLITA